MNKLKVNLKRTVNIFYRLLILVLLVIAGMSALSSLSLPKQLKIFVVLSGSMEPTIKTGSVVFVHPLENYSIKDIVTFKTHPEADIKNPKLTITHRIVGIDTKDGSTSYTTKGDKNNVEDFGKVPGDSILGKVVFTVPYLGYPVGFAKTQTGFIMLVVIPATIIIYSELISIKQEVTKVLGKKKRKKMSISPDEEESDEEKN